MARYLINNDGTPFALAEIQTLLSELDALDNGGSCKKLGRNWIGIEKGRKYVDMAKKRITQIK